MTLANFLNCWLYFSGPELKCTASIYKMHEEVLQTLYNQMTNSSHGPTPLPEHFLVHSAREATHVCPLGKQVRGRAQDSCPVGCVKAEPELRKKKTHFLQSCRRLFFNCIKFCIRQAESYSSLPFIFSLLKIIWEPHRLARLVHILTPGWGGGGGQRCQAEGGPDPYK